MTSVGIAWRAVMTDHLPPPGDPPGRTPLYSVLRIALGTPLRGLARIRVSGAERIPRKGPVMIATNHLSHIDPILVIAGSRRKVHYMAKQEHFGHPLIGPVMRAIGQNRNGPTTRRLRCAGASLRCPRRRAGPRDLPGGGPGPDDEVAPLLQSGKTGIARLASLRIRTSLCIRVRSSDPGRCGPPSITVYHGCIDLLQCVSGTG